MDLNWMQKWWLQCEWPILWITARSFCSEADDKNYMRLNKFSILCWNLKTDNVLCTVFKDIFFAVLGPMRICLEHFASWSWLLVGWPIPIWLHNAFISLRATSSEAVYYQKQSEENYCTISLSRGFMNAFAVNCSNRVFSTNWTWNFWTCRFLIYKLSMVLACFSKTCLVRYYLLKHLVLILISGDVWTNSIVEEEIHQNIYASYNHWDSRTKVHLLDGLFEAFHQLPSFRIKEARKKNLISIGNGIRTVQKITYDKWKLITFNKHSLCYVCATLKRERIMCFQNNPSLLVYCAFRLVFGPYFCLFSQCHGPCQHIQVEDKPK